jgi:hypothetical protein
MDADEFLVYDNAMNKVTPQTQAPALEAYLTRYPRSTVRKEVLQRIMIDYSQFDAARAIVAADNFLAVSPANLQAYVIEVAYRKQAADDPKADAATKKSGLDQAANVARKGLDAARQPPPSDLSAADFQKIVDFAVPTFYSAIGEDALNNKDGAAAVAAYQSELAAIKPDQLATPASLQEAFFLAQAYRIQNPPDLLNCAFYATRAATLAPDQFKAQLQPTATYCYRKYHGGVDGYDPVVAYARLHVVPGPDFGRMISPAPTDAEMANNLIKTTPDADIPKLAIVDKEFVLTNASNENVARLWAAIDGKTFTMPKALVIDSSPTVIKVAISDDAIQAGTADYTFQLKSPVDPSAVPRGSTITLSGTYDSYNANPIMITMRDAEVVGARPTQRPAPSRAASSTPVPRSNQSPSAAASSQPARGVGARPQATTASPVDIPHNYALIFATNQYEHWPTLQNPIPDADTLGTTLKSLYGFQVEEVKNPTDTQVLLKLTEYLHRTFNSQDQLLIFFSGHGYFDPYLEQGFIVPASAATVASDIGHRTLLPHSTIMQYVNNIPSKHTVLIIDACFAGTLDRKIAEGDLKGDPTDEYVHASLPELLQRKEMKRTRRYFASGGKDFVPDGLPGHHSPFMSALLVTLNREADRKGYVTLEDLQEGLQTVTPEPRWGDIQGDNEPGADIILLTQDAINKLSTPN